MKLRMIVLCEALMLAVHVPQVCHSFVLPTRRCGATAMYAQPLVSEGDWTAYLDEEGTGFIYYFNANTGESLWEKPTPTFPAVSLDDALQRTATQKQEAYLKTLKKTDKKGFFQSMMDTQATSVTEPKPSVVAVEPKKAENDWFGSILERTATDDSKSKPEKQTKPVEAKEEGDWFASLREKVDKPVSDKKEDVDWFSSFRDKDKKTVEKEPGMFGNFLSSAASKLERATKEETTRTPSQIGTDERNKAMEAIEKQKEQLGDLFGGVVDKFKTTASAKPKETTKPAVISKKEEKKIIVKEPAIVVVEAPIKVQSASYVLPHPDKVGWGGEDAVFIKGRTFGVFDGVTGANKTIGKPLYSKILAREMKSLVSDNDALMTKDLIQYLTQSKDVADKIATGASTAIVGSIDETGNLQVLNVGDSGCIVIRDNKVVAQAAEIVHYFECPYQLADFSPDKPREGKKLSFPLRRGDLILMASDGVFDNFSSKQVLDIAVREKESGLGILAKRVVELSRKNSLDSNAATPYAILAKKYQNPDYANGLGGKVDDVSCVVVSYA